MLRQSILLALLALRTNAQTTLTGCHLHGGQEVCLLPGGAETTIANADISSLQASSPPLTTPTTVAATTTAASATAAGQTTAITDCHMHGVTQYCVKGDGSEVVVQATATGSTSLPTAYNGCHDHGTEMFCMTPDGDEVAVGAEASTKANTEEESDCHFHAGVEHCTGQENTCERRDRDYNVNLRIGLLFVILATSAIAVYAPMLLKRLLKVDVSGTLFTIVKQFGTGVIIATAFVHLLTHAELMFGNECLGELAYEATATSIAMAGAFIAFLIDFIAHRLATWRNSKNTTPNLEQTTTTSSSDQKIAPVKELALSPLANSSHHHRSALATANDAVSVLVLEAGIIFHSLLLGITLVVAGDSVFITLFIVIVFHQMFEGLALGARIAAIDTTAGSKLKKMKSLVLPLAFALVTPVGMAIGIGVLNTFNGNNPSTIVALGTLDSLSAGILAWVGFVDMWAGDWIFGELKNAPIVKTLAALASLVSGMLLMGVLGKWA
ncbi:ZIP zinc transporter-domain-containing protein [Amylocarpus encephaloides]|uniref:ZIP zinc transporter-domain-containing protein n=1 Tax=Amylocarpus encephaloides TaxID=45428 RepID=A0A9P7YHB9_9HELO|nr:ZIP zinc transporter-domain-containing protein [Amylocarpus encephaloides]